VLIAQLQRAPTPAALVDELATLPYPPTAVRRAGCQLLLEMAGAAFSSSLTADSGKDRG
jgi:hypothetical protein